jgi:hypothetical protein
LRRSLDAGSGFLTRWWYKTTAAIAKQRLTQLPQHGWLAQQLVDVLDEPQLDHRGETLSGCVRLVSRTVKDLVAGAGINFADVGIHELKGVPGEWSLYAART